MVSTRCGGTFCLHVTHFVQLTTLVTLVTLLISSDHQVHGRIGDRYSRELPQRRTWDPCAPFTNQTGFLIFSPAISRVNNTYPNNINCYRVITAPEGYLIKLDFRDYFWIEHSTNCVNDYLEIRDGPYGFNKVMHRPFCGKDDYPPLITSSDRHLWLHFKSDDNIEHIGFKAIFEYIPRPSSLKTPELRPCNINATFPYEGKLGIVNITQDIRDFNGMYGFPIDCLFAITVGESWKIYLQFEEFALDRPNDCDTNFVQVFANSTDVPPLKMFCGSLADAVLSKSNKMFVRFYSPKIEVKTLFLANYTAYKDVTSGKDECSSPDQLYCDDATCIDKSLQCNQRFNCRSRHDEDDCEGASEIPWSRDHMVIIMVIFSLILIGMCITFVYNCITKLIRDHQAIQEYMRQSEQQLNELDKHGHEKKSSSKVGSQSRTHSSPSLDSNRFDAANAVTTPCYVPGGDILPILVRSEHSVSPSNGDAYNTNIFTVDNDNPPEMCDSACQTRESLFTTQGYSSGNSSPNHSVHTNSPPAPFSTFGYQKDNKFRAEAKIEMAPRSKNKYDEKRRPYSVQTTKSAPDVIVTH